MATGVRVSIGRCCHERLRYEQLHVLRGGRQLLGKFFVGCLGREDIERGPQGVVVRAQTMHLGVW